MPCFFRVILWPTEVIRLIYSGVSALSRNKKKGMSETRPDVSGFMCGMPG